MVWTDILRDHARFVEARCEDGATIAADMRMAADEIVHLALDRDVLSARVAELEHQLYCDWYEIAVGQWALDHCTECKQLDETVNRATEAANKE